MKRTVTILCLLITLSAGGVHAGPPLADRVPAESTLYVGWAGSNEAFDNTALARMAASPEAAQLIDAMLQKFDPDDRQNVALWLDVLRIALRHRVAICAIQGPPREPEHPIFGRLRFALLVDLEGDRKAFAAKLDAVWQKPMRSGRDVTVGAQKFRAFQPTGDLPTALVGYIGDTFIFAQSEALAGMMVATAAGRHKSLLTDPAFATAYRQVDGPDTQLASYLHGKSPAKLEPLRKALGAGKLNTMVSATRVVDGGFYSRMRALTPAPHRGLLMLAAGEPIAPADLAAAPGDSDLVAAWKLDPAKALEEIQRAVTAFDPAKGKAFGAGLEQIDRKLGFSLSDELLACLGDQWMLVSAPSLGGMFTGTAFMVQVKDQAAFLPVQAKIEQLIRRHWLAPPADGDGPPGPTLRTTTAGNTKITYVHLAGTQVPLAPAWAVHDGKLIIAGWPQVVSAVITGTREGPLHESEDFRSAWKRLSAPPSAVVYENSPKVTRRLYGLLMMATPVFTAELRGSSASGIGADWLPTLATFEKHLRPGILAVSSDAEGITLESYGSVSPGGPVALIGGTTALVAIAVPTIARLRAQARDVVNKTRLNGLAKGILLYETARNKMPPSLEVLVTEGMATENSLINTHTGEPGSFIYIRLPASAPGDLILIYEDPNATGRGKAAAQFADGHTETMEVNERFWKLIARSRAAARAAAAEGNR